MTKVRTDIDFERQGVRFSRLMAPHSRNDSAWGNISVPVAVFKSGSGPTILMTGGVHGDPGARSVTRAVRLRTLRPEAVQGRLLVLPALNFPAFQAGTRLSPLDGRDLNRSFPGDPKGSPTLLIADYVERILLPMTDIVMDFHSGGRSLDFLPSVIMHELDDKDQEAKIHEAFSVFGAPRGMVLREVDGGGTLDFSAEAKGKVFLSTELRGGGRVNVEGVSIAKNGILNLLRHFQIADLGGEARRTERIFRVSEDECFCHAEEEGVFEPSRKLGERVTRGETLGRLHFFQNLEREPKTVKAGIDGTLLCLRACAPSSPGDCLAVTGIES